MRPEMVNRINARVQSEPKPSTKPGCSRQYPWIARCTLGGFTRFVRAAVVLPASKRWGRLFLAIAPGAPDKERYTLDRDSERHRESDIAGNAFVRFHARKSSDSNVRALRLVSRRDADADAAHESFLSRVEIWFGFDIVVVGGHFRIAYSFWFRSGIRELKCSKCEEVCSWCGLNKAESNDRNDVWLRVWILSDRTEKVVGGWLCHYRVCSWWLCPHVVFLAINIIKIIISC